MRNRLLPLAILLVLALVFTAPASAQTINGNIVGVILDEQGAALPAVTITVTNVDTNATRTGVTNDEGLYRVAGLPVGNYTVKAEKAGFSATSANVGVTVGTDSKADITLRAGGVAEQVTVVVTGTLLDTTQSQVANIVDQTRILELPGRNSLNGLALLSPGVLPNQNGRPGSGFAVNGNRTRSNDFTIDGANNNDQSLSIPRQGLPPEAIGEFQIITNTPSAEFGRNPGSYVNQITKSGTNEFHGITTLADGTPFSVISSPNTLGIIPSAVLSTVQSTHRVGVNPGGTPGTFTTANAQGVLANPNAFYIVYPTNSGLGNSLGANTLRTGGTINTDLAAVKNFRTVGETQRFQLRAEIFNVFNHRNFTAIPSRVLSATTDPTLFLNFGRTNVAGRTFLFGARYYF